MITAKSYGKRITKAQNIVNDFNSSHESKLSTELISNLEQLAAKNKRAISELESLKNFDEPFANRDKIKKASIEIERSNSDFSSIIEKYEDLFLDIIKDEKMEKIFTQLKPYKDFKTQYINKREQSGWKKRSFKIIGVIASARPEHIEAAIKVQTKLKNLLEGTNDMTDDENLKSLIIELSACKDAVDESEKKCAFRAGKSSLKALVEEIEDQIKPFMKAYQNTTAPKFNM